MFEDSLIGVEAGCASGARTVMIPDAVPPDEQARRTCRGIFRDLGEAWAAIQREEL